jgi:molybdate transport system regulatory protein
MPKSSDAYPRLIVRIDLGAAGRIGPGKILLLERIQEYGSISAAGRSMDMSYRQAWDLVDQLNQIFRAPVVASKAGGRSGGGASLTPFGSTLLAQLKAVLHSADQATAQQITEIKDLLKPNVLSQSD